MNIKLRLTLMLLTVSAHSLFSMSSEDDDAPTKRGSKKFSSLQVKNQLNVSGNAVVGGSLTAANINLCPAAAPGTPGILGIGNALAWGEAGNNLITTNTQMVPSQGLIPLNYSSNLQGMAFNGSNALVIQQTGLYLYDLHINVDLADTVISPNQPTDVTIQLFNGTSTIPNTAFSFSGATLLLGSYNSHIPFYACPGGGTGLIYLTAGQQISISNVSPETIYLGYLPNATEAVDLVKIRLVRIA